MEFRIGIPNEIGSSSTVRSYKDDEVYVALGVFSTRNGNRRDNSFVSISFEKFDVTIRTAKHYEQIRILIHKGEKTLKRKIRRICYRILFEAFAQAPSKFRSVITEIWEEGYHKGRKDKTEETSAILQKMVFAS